MFHIRNFFSLDTNYIKRILVTPTCIRPKPPAIEQNNRVLRKYPKEIKDFARCVFCDENENKMNFDATRSEGLMNRVEKILTYGIPLAIEGYHYKFLAYGSSQMKNHSV
eukprot:UN34424